VRCYNVTREPVRGQIRLGFPVQAAYRVNLLHEEQETVAVVDNGVEVTVKGAEVYTIKMIPA
jgi:hypothetical protein